MNTTASWRSEGVRWIASLITDFAGFMDRMDSAPGGRASMHASEACDEARSQVRYRVPYY